jgi:hypothetical protein
LVLKTGLEVLKEKERVREKFPLWKWKVRESEGKREKKNRKMGSVSFDGDPFADTAVSGSLKPS